MKIIFLDIDGVMNYELMYRIRAERMRYKPSHYWWLIKKYTRWLFNGFKHKGTKLKMKQKKKYNTYKFKLDRIEKETDRQLWEWLSGLCNSLDIDICISSTWRSFFTVEEWDSVLAHFGFDHGRCVGITRSGGGIRGEQIRDFLATIECEKYAILDDDSDMLEEQMESFFNTDHYIGITPKVIYKLRNHFEEVKEKEL
jgi:hypothetical protein